MADGIVKLVAPENSSDSHLRRDVGEAGDENDGNAFQFDLSSDRSAATSTGSSGGGQNYCVHPGAGKLVGDGLAEICHLARHGAGSSGDEIVIVELLESLGLL